MSQKILSFEMFLSKLAELFDKKRMKLTKTCNEIVALLKEKDNDRQRNGKNGRKAMVDLGKKLNDLLKRE